MSRIVPLSTAHLPILREHAHELFHRYGLPGTVDQDQWVATWARLMQTGIGKGYLIYASGASDPCGGILWIETPDIHRGGTSAQVVVWHGPGSSRLIQLAEADCRARGIERLRVPVRTKSKTKAFFVLDDNGYEFQESWYGKELNDG